MATTASVVLVHRVAAGEIASAARWLESATFAVALLGFLAAHEAGHHVVGRAHGMRMSWPLFLPAPFFVGTLGALLEVRTPARSRTALLEMGAAGPLVGFGALIVLVVVRFAAFSAPPGGDPLTPPLMWSVAGVIAGHAAPLTTADPLGYAISVGCLVTTMNLLPFGQLDGGHVAVAAWPGQARLVGWGVLAALALAGFAWWGWWAWAVAVAVVARRTAPTPDGADPTLRARAMAIACAAAWIACVTPAPW